MAKSKSTKPTEADKPKKSNKKAKKGIIGVLQLLAVASIAYSTTVIIIGTEGYIPMVLVAPQAILATAIAIKKFSN